MPVNQSLLFEELVIAFLFLFRNKSLRNSYLSRAALSRIRLFITEYCHGQPLNLLISFAPSHEATNPHYHSSSLIEYQKNYIVLESEFKFVENWF